MNLLVFNLATDADDPVLGFTTAWLKALARYCDHIHVVTVRKGRLDLPANVAVYSVGKEKGYGKPRKVIEFYRHLGHIVSSERIDACFAHMQPLFAVLGSPLLKARRIPITLWYTHKSLTWLLHLAEKLVDQIVTASPESCRLPSRKVIVMGHGIDTDVFVPTPVPGAPGQPFTIASIGRIAPIKRLETLIEAIHILVYEHELRDLQVRIVGHTYPYDMTYAKGLHQQIADMRLNGYVSFLGAVPFSRVATEYQRADVVANLSDTDSVDKTIVEAMSCGVPVVTSNLAARSVLHEFAESLMVAKGDSTQLASRIWELSRQTPMERQATGQRLRRIAVEEHSLQKLASRLVHTFCERRLE